MSKRVNYVLSQKYRQNKSPREIFLHKKQVLEYNEPFTKKQTKQFTLQQKNYIRGIQIARNIKKSDAIKLYRKSLKDTKLLKKLSLEITGESEIGIALEPSELEPPVIGDGVRKGEEKEKRKEGGKKKRKKLSKKEYGAPKGKKYKYAGKPLKATKKQLSRFKSLGGKSRRYIDTKTGEEISRRERDKRL